MTWVNSGQCVTGILTCQEQPWPRRETLFFLEWMKMTEWALGSQEVHAPSVYLLGQNKTITRALKSQLRFLLGNIPQPRRGNSDHRCGSPREANLILLHTFSILRTSEHTVNIKQYRVKIQGHILSLIVFCVWCVFGWPRSTRSV